MAGIYLVEITAKLDQQVLRSGPYVDANGTYYVAGDRIAYNAANAYTVTGSVRRNAAANGDMYMGLRYFDASGVPITDNWPAASAVTPGTGWATYTGTLAAGAAPGGTAYIAPVIVLNHATGTAGYHECQSLRVALSTSPTVALNVDEFFRTPTQWQGVAAGVAIFARLFDGTPYTATLRFGTAGFMTKPSDTPPNTYCDGRVLQPALLHQDMPAEYAGSASVGFGELVLGNGDGALNDLMYAGFDGQLVRVLVGDSDNTLASFTEQFRAVANQAIADDKRLRIQLKDGLTVLDRPLLTTTFLGNNALPNGLEGGDDIKGLPKPKLFGIVQNLPPPCVNTTRLIYLVSDGGFQSAHGGGGDVTAVYDRGVALTRGTGYVSQADMEANAPAAGEYRLWFAGAMFRLGSTPTGLVTCDAQADVSGDNSWQGAMTKVALAAGLGGGQIDIEANWTTDSKPDNWPGTNLHDVGVWVNDSRTAIEALQLLAESCGVMFGWIAKAVYHAPALYAEHWPRPYAVREDVNYGSVWYPGNAIISVRPVAATEEGAGVPAWRVQLGYSPILQIQEFDVDAAAGQARRSFLANERRQLTVSDTGIKTKHANAVTLQRDTQIISAAAATDEATRLLQLRRYRRAWFEVIVNLDGACEPDSTQHRAVLNSFLRPRLGGYVRLSHDALTVRTQDGVASTDAWFNVMSLEIDNAKNTARMTVRQATEPTL